MSLRARIFIIVSVVVLLVLAVSIFLIVRNKTKTVDTTPTTNTNTTLPSTNDGSPSSVQALIDKGLPAKTPTPLEVEQNAVEQFAKVFVERYGTYSTDNEFQNIKESQPLVTKSLWSKISTGINAKETNQDFLGLTTKVMSVRLASWEPNQATVELKTMRAEDKNGVISNRYQNATVGMVKENGVWLANALSWN